MGLFSGRMKGNDGAYTPSAKFANSYSYPGGKREATRVEKPARAGAKGSPKNAKSN